MNKKGMRITKPVVLLILDGWGDRADGDGNAIADARTPTWDSLMANTPHCLLICSGEDVGLPKGQMGNSEVGHLTIGAGRVIDQDLTRISKAIEQGDFFENRVLKDALDRAQKNHRAVHVLGLLSPGGVHSHEEHLFACLQMAQRHHCERIYLHAFLDGRDTPPRSAKASIEKCEALLKTIPQARLASVCGRYYAMDRDKRWDRIKLAYDLIAHGSAPYKAHSGIEALEKAYARSETDEFVKPTAILTSNNECSIVSPGDLIIFMNFRSDRARELTEAFISPQFTAFDRGFIPIGEFVSLTEYDKTFNTSIGFPPQSHANGLTEYLSKQHLKQLHLAETEKYAHVTFFFNGGIEKAFPGEERILIPSPKIATYDLQPEMSAPALTDALVENILNQQFDFIVCNYANADMLRAYRKPQCHYSGHRNP